MDVALIREGDVLRFLVRTFAEPHTGAELDHVVHVRRGAPEVGLQHDADRVAEFRIEDVLEQLERPGGIARLLHVDAHERLMLLCPADDGAHVVDAQLLVDVEPHLRKLDGDIGVGLGGVNAVEQIEIGATGAPGFLDMQDGFPEEIERRRQVATVQVANGGDRLVERFAGDEPRGQLAGEPVLPHEAKDSRLFAQPQERGAQHQA